MVEFGTPSMVAGKVSREKPEHFSGEQKVGGILVRAGYDERGKRMTISLESDPEKEGEKGEMIFFDRDDLAFSEDIFKYAVSALEEVQDKKQVSKMIQRRVNEKEAEIAREEEYLKRVDPETGEEWEMEV